MPFVMIGCGYQYVGNGWDWGGGGGAPSATPDFKPNRVFQIINQQLFELTKKCAILFYYMKQTHANIS